MAAPQFVPESPTDKVLAYASPDHVPATWSADRPAEVRGRQPHDGASGSQGPDQGYAMLLANLLRPKVRVSAGESVDDALCGCLNVALRRASLFGRAPVVHDLTIALTIFGFLDGDAPSELVAWRKPAFEGVANAVHHYFEGRAIAQSVPEATLRMTPGQVAEQFPAAWRALVGV